MESLQYVIQKCKANEEKYQKILFEQYKQLFMGTAIRYVKTRERAKDVVQDSFVKIFMNINDLEQNSSFEPWALKIVVNTSINAYKDRLKKSLVSLNNLNGVAKSTIGIEHKIVAQMDHHFLLDLIQSMPEGYRTVFNLYMVDGFSHKEIADLLDISEGTSRSQLYKAKHYLIELIEKVEV